MLKNVIFDFGGVFLNLDFNRSFDAFEALGLKNMRELFTQYSAAPLFKQIEVGAITPGEFYEGIRTLIGAPVKDEELQSAWNAMLLDYRKPSLDFLIPLAERYNLFLLSNTNQIHYAHFSKTLTDETGYASLGSFFTRAYYSHEINRRKPDSTTYQFLLEDAGLVPGETLFIDDSYTNLPAAQELGIQTHLLLPEERVEYLEVLQ